MKILLHAPHQRDIVIENDYKQCIVAQFCAENTKYAGGFYDQLYLYAQASALGNVTNALKHCIGAIE